MKTAMTNLLALLDIETLDDDLYRGLGSGGETSVRIFGGHVIAQALAAAYRTVTARACHSLHAYFIRPGDPDIPVIYRVERARDGGSFATRRIVAIQHGREILNMLASFHVAEDGWHHQHQMPDVPPAETLPTRESRRKAEAHRLPPHKRAEFTRPRAIDIREIAPQDFFEPRPAPDENQLWFRMLAAGGTSPAIQQCLLAYASDMNLLGSAMRPHGLTWFKGGVMTASLDHAMWFHRPIAFENWHLYAMDSPFSGGGRGFNRGSVFDAEGRLVASVAQEGLMRRRRDKAPT